MDANEQEGIDTLEERKGVDKELFVTILSAHPDIKRVERMARNLSVALFRAKSLDTREDIHLIVREMLKRVRDTVDQEITQLDPPSADFHFVETQNMPNSTLGKPTIHPSLAKDPNFQASQQKSLDPNWIESNRGYYVAFVDGQDVSKNKDLNQLIEELRASPLYQNKPVYFTPQIGSPERIIDLPSSAWMS